jgi:hypothetical protein
MNVFLINQKRKRKMILCKNCGGKFKEPLKDVDVGVVCPYCFADQKPPVKEQKFIHSEKLDGGGLMLYDIDGVLVPNQNRGKEIQQAAHGLSVAAQMYKDHSPRGRASYCNSRHPKRNSRMKWLGYLIAQLFVLPLVYYMPQYMSLNPISSPPTIVSYFQFTIRNQSAIELKDASINLYACPASENVSELDMNENNLIGIFHSGERYEPEPAYMYFGLAMCPGYISVSFAPILGNIEIILTQNKE